MWLKKLRNAKNYSQVYLLFPTKGIKIRGKGEKWCETRVRFHSVPGELHLVNKQTSSLAVPIFHLVYISDCLICSQSGTD
jgi:hypothetical protein